ncbi:tautomerase family protein [Rhodococcus sp. CSLK01-03]|uniref:Tautomerase family protein n=1 Tax=Rhodococcus indonesiensis TaxID=3055869 RepID=A0ABT7RNX6_9NOCA|nr:tautomerase family protein [Rhodococcus indonesiensis]MDM7489340.1 tautomerase family protein [Rhodococcus indonesiensis]
MELTYQKGALADSARAGLVGELTELLMKWEGVPDTDFFRAATWLHVHERQSWECNRGGVPAAETPYLLAVTVPAGALSERRKAGLIEEATTAILAADGGTRDPYRVWVHIHEIPDGNWGAGGKPIFFEALRKAAAQAQASAAAEQG